MKQIDEREPSVGLGLLDTIVRAWIDVAVLARVPKFKQASNADNYDDSRVAEHLAAVAWRNAPEGDLALAARGLADLLQGYVSYVRQNLEIDWGSLVPEWDSEVSQILKNIGSVQQAASQRIADLQWDSSTTAKAAAASAVESARVAREAAGMTAEGTLAQYFETYGKGEIKSSNMYRFAAVAALALTVVGGVWFFVEAENKPGNLPLESIVFRTVSLLALAGISTYFIRLAGQHRMEGNWARSIGVQLKSLAAFAKPLEGLSAWETTYIKFGERVLGAPPTSRNAEPEGITISARDILALIPKSP